MKYTNVQKLIQAHYESEDVFYSMVDKIITAERNAGRETPANKLWATLMKFSGKKRNGYTVKPLHELNALNKDNNEMLEIRQPDITLDDVIAPENTLKPIYEIIHEFKNRDKLTPYGLEVLNKVLISGPPGVGKTWTAMAIAGELELELVIVRWDSLISSYLGNTGRNIREVFKVANKKPIALFLDEFDSVGKERGGTNSEVGEMARIVINLLQNIDMFSPESFLIAATNHGYLLDTAVWRRFTVVNMDLPEDDDRFRLIQYYSKELPIHLDIEQWVKETKGMSGAEIRTKIHKKAKTQILNWGNLKHQLA